MTSISHGFPSVWGTTRARVFSETAPSINPGFMLYVPTSQSTNTGTSPLCTRGATVVGNVTAGGITSSPCRSRVLSCLDNHARTPARVALGPEVDKTKTSAPDKTLLLFSNQSPD